MTDRLISDKPVIEPIYWQHQPNQTIELGQGAVQFDINGTPHQDNGIFSLRFAPDKRLVIRCLLKRGDWTTSMAFFPDTSARTFELLDRGISFEAFCVSGGSKSGEVVFTPTRTPVIVTTTTQDDLVSVTFHLFNFPGFIGPDSYALRTNEGSLLCDRVILRADGWRITISATWETKQRLDELKQQGGYVITHVGQVEQENGSTFSSTQLKNLFAGFCSNSFHSR